ncbi:MAG TPA: DUF2069 domain-containing protein [Lysobacter sp.]|jgi:uncharacterized membrane protein|nr:DUF2069 domain-containing protein [Lysobacter sp.]
MSVFAGGIARRVLIVALITLAGLYLLWFGATPSPWAALMVFALPPAALAMAALRGWRQAGFWAGVLALAWFSHGVMVAWTRAPERVFATAEIVLALVIVFAASIPGMRARFSKRRP